MTRCALQAGLLAPEPCPNSAIGACARCGVEVCEAHATLADDGLVCRTCQMGVAAGTDPMAALAAVAAGLGVAALFSAGDVAAFAAAALEDEPDDLTADLS